MSFSPGLRGGNQLAGGSLLAVAAILIRIQVEREGGGYVLVCVNNFIPCYISPGLRGGNRLAGGSLLTFTTILVRIQAEREGGIMFWYVLLFLYNVPFSWAARGHPLANESLLTVTAILVHSGTGE